MIERTPAQFRAIYGKWSERHKSITDSKIIPPNPELSASPRHGDLSKELQGLLYWRHINRDVQPLSTNWMAPDNENNFEGEEDEPRSPKRSTECEHVVRPSEGDLMAAVEGVEFEVRAFNYKVPLPGPNVGYGDEYKTCNPLTGTVRPIARLGSIRFSTNDSVGVGSNTSPTRSSIVGWHAEPNTRGYFPIDQFGKPKGTGEDQEDIDSSNQFFAELLGAQPHRYIESGPSRRVRRGATQMPVIPPTAMGLDEARAFCGLLPSVPSNDNRPALPCGSRKVSDSFLGHKIAANADDVVGSDSPEDLAIRVQERTHIRAKLSAADVKILDTAVCASNYEDIGKAFDFTGKTAERQGKRLLLRASGNLSALIDKVAA